MRIKELSQDELNALVETLSEAILPPLLFGEGGPELTLNLASDTGRKGGLMALVSLGWLSKQGLSSLALRSDPVLTGNTRSFSESWLLAQALANEATSQASIRGDLQSQACSDLLPHWNSLNAWRSELGFRSCLHTGEKLLNPFPKTPLVLGISHRQYAERMAITLAGQGQRGFIVLGNHGTPDLVLHKPTEVLEITASGLTKEWLIDLAAWGLTPPSEIYSVARLPEWSTWMLTGDRGWWDGLLGQSAFLWYAAGRAESLNAAAEQMRRFRDEERGLKK
jgi:hypothetical protein